MIVTKEESLSLQAIFVKRADILNGIRIETRYSLEMVKLL